MKVDVPPSYSNLIVFTLCAGILSNALDVYVSGVRYLAYLVPPAVLMIWVLYGGRHILPFRRRFLVASLMLAAAPVPSLLLTNPHGNPLPFLAFTAVPMLVGTFVYGVTRTHVLWLLATLALSLIIVAGHDGFGSELFDFVNSSGLAESQMSFPLVLTTIALVAAPLSRILAIASTVLMLISFKRISVVAAASAVPTAMLLHVVGPLVDRSQPVRVGIAFFAFLFLGALSMTASDAAVTIQQMFPTVFSSAESLLLGRYEFTRVTGDVMSGAPDAAVMFGFGAGTLRSILGDNFFPQIKDFLLHNDYLFVRFEYGLVGFVLVYGAFAIALSQTRLALLLAVAQGVLFMTDNTLIYSFHIYALLMCENFVRSLTGHPAAGPHLRPIPPAGAAEPDDGNLVRGT